MMYCMKMSYKEFRTQCEKQTPQLYFDYFYRKISYPVTYFFFLLNVSPFSISLLSVFFNVPAAVLMISGRPKWGLIFFMISYLFDFCDGNAARVVMRTRGQTERERKMGILIETVNTNVSLFFFFFSLAVYLGDSSGYRIGRFGFIIFGAKMVMRYGMYQASRLSETVTPIVQKPQIPVSKFTFLWFKEHIKFFLRKSFFSSNFYYPVYLLAFLLFPSWKQVMYLFFAYGSLDILFSIVRITHGFRMYLGPKESKQGS